MGKGTESQIERAPSTFSICKPLLNSSNKKCLLALPVSLHARETLNWKPIVFNLLFLTLLSENKLK